jgi:chaperonin GroEL
VSLYNARLALDTLETASAAEQAGVRVVSRALEEPLRAILESSQCDVSACLRNIELASDQGVGFNCVTGRVEDLTKEGILDATKGVRIALEVGISCARSVLTTGMWDQTIPKPVR